VIEKMIVKLRKLDDTYMKGYVQPEAGAPPPSDYFLGFRSPGTQVRTILAHSKWSYFVWYFAQLALVWFLDMEPTSVSRSRNIAYVCRRYQSRHDQGSMPRG
jgi:hypothetical protein